MNAIDQYVAPPPPRPDQQQAASSSSRSSNDGNTGPSFGDVYNRSANSSQNDQQKSQEGNPAQANAQSTSDAAGKPLDEKTTSQSKVSGVIFTLTGETATAATLKKTGAADDKAAKAATAEELAKAMADAEDALAKAKGDKKDADQKATNAQQPDNAAELLKLLGAQAGVEGKSKKTASEADTKQLGTDKDKKADAKDKDGADAKAATTANDALAAANLPVEAVGNRPGNQDDQNGKNAKAQADASVLKAINSGTGKSTDNVPGTESDGKAAKSETLTVLEARRFVGSGEGLSSNTHALISGMKGDSDWAAAMKAASAANTNVPEQRTATPVNTLKIQMTPENLGNVTATLRLHGDQLTVHLSVESAEAFKQLSHDKDGLVQSLKSQGFTVDQVSVQMTPASVDKSVAQSSSGQQTGGQQAGGQQMQDGSAGQFAQQRGQENNRRQQENGFSANWQADDRRTTIDTGSVASDSARTGQVYL